MQWFRLGDGNGNHGDDGNANDDSHDDNEVFDREGCSADSLSHAVSSKAGVGAKGSRRVQLTLADGSTDETGIHNDLLPLSW